MKEKTVKSFINLAVYIFLFFALLGFISALINPQGASFIVDRLSSTFDFVKRLNPLQVFLFIFFNNSIKVFLVMILGTFFGIIPILFLISNGYIVGIISAVRTEQGIAKVIVSLLPHGVVELTGVFIACGYGLWLGYKFYRFVFFRESFRPAFSEALKKFYRIVIPLLIVAALIETFVTPELVNIFG